MTEEILTVFKQDIAHLKLIPSDGGCFEVSLAQQKIYSKLETGQFPDGQWIVNELARRMEK